MLSLGRYCTTQAHAKMKSSEGPMRIVIGHLPPTEPRIVIGALFPKVQEAIDMKRRDNMAALLAQIEKEGKVPPKALLQYPGLVGRSLPMAKNWLRGRMKTLPGWATY